MRSSRPRAPSFYYHLTTRDRIKPIKSPRTPTHPPTPTHPHHSTPQGYSSLLLAEFKYGGETAETFGAVLDQAEPRWAFLQMKKYVRINVRLLYL